MLLLTLMMLMPGTEAYEDDEAYVVYTNGVKFTISKLINMVQNFIKVLFKKQNNNNSSMLLPLHKCIFICILFFQ